MFRNGREPLWSGALSRACGCQAFVLLAMIVTIINWLAHGCGGP